MNDERVLYQGSSSQILNADVFLICLVTIAVIVAASIFFSPLILAALILPVAIGFWKWLQLRCRVYELTSERLRLRQGVFTRTTEEMELYRVVDISVVEPFFLRWLGLGNIVITTSDRSSPVVTIPAIRQVEVLREELRLCVEACRDRKRVRLTEFDTDAPEGSA